MQLYWKETPAQEVFSCDSCEILRTTFLKNTSARLLLKPTAWYITKTWYSHSSFSRILLKISVYLLKFSVHLFLLNLMTWLQIWQAQSYELKNCKWWSRKTGVTKFKIYKFLEKSLKCLADLGKADLDKTTLNWSLTTMLLYNEFLQKSFSKL